MKLKTKILPITFIIVLLLCFVGACDIFDNSAKNKKSIRKEVEKIFAKLETINYSDLEKYISENYDDIDLEYISKNYNDWKKSEFSGLAINQKTDYIYKIISEIGNIKEGDTLIDLGSGFGIDCLLLRHIIIGDKGKVVGIDIEELWNVVATKYCKYLGYNNADFILGDAREIPLDNNIADVVISNYTFTLISEKEKVFSEIFRVLKDGGNFYVMDAVVYGDNFDLLEIIKNDSLKSNWYINRSVREEEYLKILEKIGFKSIKIEIYDICMINAAGHLVNVSVNEIDKFRDKIISASVYIYAEK